MINIRTKAELEIIKENALMVTATLTEVAKFLKPGITTKQIDDLAETFMADHGGSPSFKNYNGYKYATCISVNEVVVHGMPSDYVIKEGDIVSVDCGFYRNGYHGDHAYTFAVGEVSDEVNHLLRVTKRSLELGIAQAKVNNRVGDIGYVIEQYCEKEHGFGVVRDLVGHGVGKYLHEDPQVPNYGRRGDGKRLKEGMVLAIEPMINLGRRQVNMLDDGWTIVTIDNKPSAHFEHTITVGIDGGIAFSDFAPIEAAIKQNQHLTLNY